MNARFHLFHRSTNTNYLPVTCDVLEPRLLVAEVVCVVNNKRVLFFNWTDCERSQRREMDDRKTMA